MQLLKKIPFYLLLLAIFFCVHGAAENFGSLNFKEVFNTGISILVFILILFLPVWLFARNLKLAALISFFILLWFLFFGAIHDFVKSISFLHFIQSYTVFIPLLLIATVAWIIFIRRKKESWPKLTLYLNILLIVYCLVDAGRLVYQSMDVKTVQGNLPFNYAAVKQKPDVFFLLFDGYPGQKSLSDSFHFSNKEVYDFLDSDSFHFLPVSANYNVTQFSMSSILNMKYIKPGYDADRVGQKDEQARQNEINDAAVFNIFEKAGYRIENNSIFDVKNMPGTFNSNGFILAHNFLLTDKILVNRMSRDIGGQFPGFMKKNPFLHDMSPEAHKDDNNVLIKKLLQLADQPAGKQPVFCYTHLVMPHGPYLFDSTGKETDPAIYSAPRAWMNRGNFISYLEYTNTVLKKLVTAIRQKKPGAIVIVMSDHGFREYLDDNSVQASHFDNICAVHFPGKTDKQAPDTLTNVNFFRYLFNDQFGQKLPYLKDTAVALKLQ